MKVLVTGGAGNIGITLINRLVSQGIETTIFDLPQQIDVNRNRIPSQTNVFQGSILDTQSLNEAANGCTHIVHLAATLGVKNTEKNKLKCLEINILGTKAILDAAVNADVSRFIFASSSETYGEPLATPISEDMITQGKTIYAVSKLAGEEFVKAYAQKHKHFDFTILRFFNVFGPDQVGQFVISKFVQNAKKNLPITINGDGKQQRAYCYVDDAVEGILLSMNSNKAKGETINIGNPDNLTSINRLADMICDILQIDKSLIQIDKTFENSDRDEKREIYKRYPDVSKAESLLGYQAKVGLREALEEVVAKSTLINDWPE